MHFPWLLHACETTNENTKNNPGYHLETYTCIPISHILAKHFNSQICHNVVIFLGINFYSYEAPPPKNHVGTQEQTLFSDE